MESLRSFRSKFGSIISQDSKAHLMPSILPTICVTSESEEELPPPKPKEERKSISAPSVQKKKDSISSPSVQKKKDSISSPSVPKTKTSNTKGGSDKNNLTMNEDPYLVRRVSAAFQAALEDEEEEDEDSFDMEIKTPLRKMSSSGLTDTDMKLNPPKHSFELRRGVTGSISVPINKMSLKLYGSEKAVMDEQNRLQQAGSWIIHPYSNFRLMWDCVTLVLLLVNIILIPVAIAFWKDNESSWLPFKYVTDVWFLLDIFFNFRTGIVIDGPDSEVVLDPREIKAMYLKTWFAIDLISTFPFDLIFTLIDSLSDAGAIHGQQLKALNLFRLAKILALLRLLRLSRFIRYMKQWEEIFNFQYEIALAFARIINLIMLMLFICHFNGCLQWMVPMFLDFPEKTWVRERNLHRVNVSVWERYSWSVFKSTSHMLCIGYGLSPPQGLIDVWVTYVSMLSGAMCFALFIGNATSLIQSMDASKRAYKEKFMQVKEYMQFRKLPPIMRRKMSDYYENRFQGKMFDEKKILSELNHNLREEVINSTCRDLIEQVPLFNEADPYFINAILAKLEFEVFLMEEPIVREGSIGTKMYFISRGTVIIKSAQHNIKQSLSDGCYFGEIALLQPNLRRVASVIAETYCYLYSLSSSDFNDILEEFPIQKKRINHFVQSRIRESIVHPEDFISSSTSPDEDRLNPASKSSLKEIEEESSSIWEEEEEQRN